MSEKINNSNDPSGIEKLLDDNCTGDIDLQKRINVFSDIKNIIEPIIPNIDITDPNESVLIIATNNASNDIAKKSLELVATKTEVVLPELATDTLRSGYCQVVEENNNVANEIINTVSSEDEIIIDNNEEIDITSLNLDKDLLFDDGFLGIPLFSDKELSIIENNLMMDTSIIDSNRLIMAAAFETIKSFKDNLILSDDEKKILKEAENTYKSARNLLIQYKQSVLEYFKFIDENKYEILGDLKDEAAKMIEKYIDSTTKEFNLIYTNDSLMFYIIAVAIKRAIKNIENDSVYKILTLNHVNDFDINFEKEIYEILKPIYFLSSNMSNAYELDKMSSVERDVIKMMSSIVTRFRKFSVINDDLNTKCEKLIGSSRGIFISFLFKLSTIIGKKVHFDFRDEKRKYTLKLKNINKKSKKPVKFFPFHDNFIKTRISLYIVEFYIKKLFSLSLFGDQKVLDKKETFLSLVDEMNNKFKSTEIVQSLINTFSFKLIFNELVNIFKFIDNDKYTNNFRRVNMLKSYLMFIAYHKHSTVYKDYKFKELYSEYFNTLLNEIEKFVNKK